MSVRTANGRKTCLALAETGSSATLANKTIISECCKEKEKKEVEWATQGDNFNTKCTARVTDLKLPQFTRNQSVKHKMYLFIKHTNNCSDFIFGRDFLQTIDIEILFSKRMLAWDRIEIDIFSRNELSKNLDNVKELRTVESKVILDVDYEKPDLELVAAEQEQLTSTQKDIFLKILRSREAAFTYKYNVLHKIELSHKIIGVPVEMPLLVPLNNLLILHNHKKQGKVGCSFLSPTPLLAI